MPRGDRTGPAGAGPMSGRAAGYCAGYLVPGFMNPIRGRGFWPRRSYWGLPAAYGPPPHWQGFLPYGYRFPYVPVWGGRFGRGRGRWFGRGWGRGFHRGRGWGRW
jgi:hypothetical protein